MAGGQRGELRRADLARRGLVTVMVAALLLALLTGRSTGLLGGPAEVYAHVANAGGSLAEGADVKLRGVIIGKVAGVERGEDGGVRITLAMDDGKLDHVPGNVVARVLPATVFGTSFVDLTTHGDPVAKRLGAGAEIPADRSQRTLELQQALDDIDGLIKALRPAQLNVTLGAIATALDGRGEQIGGVLDQLSRLLTRVEPEVSVIQADLSKLVTNLRLVSDTAPPLLDGVRDSLGTLRTVVDQKAALGTLLTGGRRTVAEANRLLKRVGPDLVSFLRNALIVGDVFYDLRHDAFTESFATLREVYAKLQTVVKHGWVDNTLLIQTDTPPYYDAGDCPRFGTAAGDNCAGSSAGAAKRGGVR